MKHIYKDYIPANARILVDYKNKERVKFSYPREWTYLKAVWVFGYQTVLSWWLSLHIFIIVKYMSWFLVILASVVVWFSFSPVTTVVPEKVVEVGFNTFFPGILLGCYVLGIPAIITWVLSFNKNWLSNTVPKMGFWAAKLCGVEKKKTFFAEDVTEQNVCVIPHFANVSLDYEASGDFNRFLERVDIYEIPFEYQRRCFWLPWKMRTVKNDLSFRAVFIFSRKPCVGSLRTSFV